MIDLKVNDESTCSNGVVSDRNLQVFIFFIDDTKNNYINVHLYIQIYVGCAN